MSQRYQAGIVLPGYNALKVANAPTIGTATQASSTSVSVAFTAPACVGGGAISSYTVFANCGVKTASGASSPLTVTGLTTGTTYTFKAVATNAYGPSYPSAASNSVTLIVQGQQAYITAGSYSWVAPACVSSVSVVVVGGAGGSGGALAYKNNYSVTAGNSYSLRVQAGSTGGCCASYFNSICTVRAGSGSYRLGDGGGNGGANAGGGGGAGGYSGNGGAGACSGNGTNGSGGGGAGGSVTSCIGGGGGGVGILGQGANGTINACGRGGGGGSGGANGTNAGAGGAYGGGAGSTTNAGGAVRVIWPGTTRSFPSTNTGDL